MQEKSLSLLSNMSPLVGIAVLAAIVWGMLSRIKGGQDGKDALIGMLWFSPLVFLGFNLHVVVNMGGKFIDIANNVISMLGFGGIK